MSISGHNHSPLPQSPNKQVESLETIATCRICHQPRTATHSTYACFRKQQQLETTKINREHVRFAFIRNNHVQRKRIADTNCGPCRDLFGESHTKQQCWEERESAAREEWDRQIRECHNAIAFTRKYTLVTPIVDSRRVKKLGYTWTPQQQRATTSLFGASPKWFSKHHTQHLGKPLR